MQEVQAAAATAAKDLAQFERQEIGLQEKRKHTNGRIKKLKKTIADVRLYHFHCFFDVLTNNIRMQQLRKTLPIL